MARPSLSCAFESPGAKLGYNRRLFATIAPRYDFITRFLSYGQDARWKRRVADVARSEGVAGAALDLACGTGDIAGALAADGRAVTGLDLTPAMLKLAARRTYAGAPPAWVCADMMRLPFPDASFAVVTAGYGLRNVPVLDVAIAEIARVLRPGGLFVSLDFNRPDSSLVRAIYLGYLTLVGSAAGLALHGDADTYRYIPHSIRRYPGARGVAERLASAGFSPVRVEPKLGGLMSIHVARKL